MGNLLAVTEANFEEEVKNSGLPVLVDFWAPWCGPCLQLGPIVEQIAADYQGKVKVCKINTDEAQNLAVQFGIQSIPCLVLIKNGQEADRMGGARPKQTVTEWLISNL
jgi:thioredoxin 1